MTGCRDLQNVGTSLLMLSNWAFRRESALRPFDLRCPLRLKPSRDNKAATLRGPMARRLRDKRLANCFVLRQVQRKGAASAEPPQGLISLSSANSSLGVRCSRPRRSLGRGCRARSLSRAGWASEFSSSRWPRQIVVRLNPVTWATAVVPPGPMSRASTAAQRRRRRSFINRSRGRYFASSRSRRRGSSIRYV